MALSVRIAGNAVKHSYLHEEGGIWWQEGNKPSTLGSAPRSLKTLLVDLAEESNLIRVAVVPKTLEGRSCFRCKKEIANIAAEFCVFCSTRVLSLPGTHLIYDTQSAGIELKPEDIATDDTISMHTN